MIIIYVFFFFHLAWHAPSSFFFDCFIFNAFRSLNKQGPLLYTPRYLKYGINVLNLKWPISKILTLYEYIIFFIPYILNVMKKNKMQEFLKLEFNFLKQNNIYARHILMIIIIIIFYFDPKKKMRQHPELTLKLLVYFIQYLNKIHKHARARDLYMCSPRYVQFIYI